MAKITIENLIAELKASVDKLEWVYYNETYNTTAKSGHRIVVFFIPQESCWALRVNNASVKTDSVGITLDLTPQDADDLISLIEDKLLKQAQQYTANVLNSLRL